MNELLESNESKFCVNGKEFFGKFSKVKNVTQDIRQTIKKLNFQINVDHLILILSEENGNGGKHKVSDYFFTKKSAELILMSRRGKIGIDFCNQLLIQYNLRGEIIEKAKNVQNDYVTKSDLLDFAKELIKELLPVIKSRTEIVNQPKQIEYVPTITDRQKIRKNINQYAYKKSILYVEAWEKLYSEVYYRLNINLKIQSKNKGVNCLDIAEDEGIIGKLLYISEEMVRETSYPIRTPKVS